MGMATRTELRVEAAEERIVEFQSAVQRDIGSILIQRGTKFNDQ